jgi:DNA-binding MarR family transcriptional regulator
MAKRPKGKSRSAARTSKAPLTVTRPELLEGGSDRKFRLLINGLFALFSAASTIRDGYASCLGLAGPQYTIMLCIRHLESDGDVNVSTIAEHTRMSGSFITVETSKLKEAGLLTKSRMSDDRRMVTVSLTAKGNALLDSIAKMRCQVNNVQFGCLSAAEFQMLVPLVQRLVDSGERAVALLKLIRNHDQFNKGIPGLEEFISSALQPRRASRDYA